MRTNEGPLDFAARAGTSLPQHAAALRQVGEIYARLRYSGAPPALTELIRAIRAVPKLSRPVSP